MRSVGKADDATKLKNAKKTGRVPIPEILQEPTRRNALLVSAHLTRGIEIDKLNGDNGSYVRWSRPVLLGLRD